MKTLLVIAMVFAATQQQDLCRAFGAYVIYDENGNQICGS